MTVLKMQNFNLEKWIVINSNKTITIEEEKEILDLARQVLRRKDENRKVFLLWSVSKNFNRRHSHPLY